MTPLTKPLQNGQYSPSIDFHLVMRRLLLATLSASLLPFLPTAGAQQPVIAAFKMTRATIDPASGQAFETADPNAKLYLNGSLTLGADGQITRTLQLCDAPQSTNCVTTSETFIFESVSPSHDIVRLKNIKTGQRHEITIVARQTQIGLLEKMSKELGRSLSNKLLLTYWEPAAIPAPQPPPLQLDPNAVKTQQYSLTKIKAATTKDSAGNAKTSITGIYTNLTGKTVAGANIYMNLYNKDKVKISNMLGNMDIVSNIPPGKTAAFEIPVFPFQLELGFAHYELQMVTPSYVE